MYVCLYFNSTTKNYVGIKCIIFFVFYFIVFSFLLVSTQVFVNELVLCNMFFLFVLHAIRLVCFVSMSMVCLLSPLRCVSNAIFAVWLVNFSNESRQCARDACKTVANRTASIAITSSIVIEFWVWTKISFVGKGFLFFKYI